MHSSLAYQVSFLRRSFVQFSNEQLERSGLTQGLLYFVLYIGKHTGCTLKELAGALHMDAGHTTRCVAKLQADGFVMRRTDANDQRRRRLVLTEKGEALFAECHALSAQWDEAALAALDPQQRQQLQDLLGKVMAGLLRKEKNAPI